MRPTRTYLLALALAAGSGLLLVLSAGALGIIGAGGRADRPFLAVLAVLVVGSVLSRLRARGMAWTLAATAVTHGAATVVALTTAPSSAEASSVDVAAITMMFMALFGVAAWLFNRADADRRRAPRGGAVSW